MALLKIVWTATALKQRNHIFEYWNDRNASKIYSQKLNNKIKGRVQLLKSNPEIGLKTSFKETRVISLGHYSLLYKRMDSTMVITSFWDNRQDPKKLLAFLKKN